MVHVSHNISLAALCFPNLEYDKRLHMCTCSNQLATEKYPILSIQHELRFSFC